MRSGHRSAWRRRGNSRAARLAVPLAIPMALGLTLGIILAVSGGHTTQQINQSAMGASSSPSASTSGAAGGAAAALATPTATAAAAAVPPAPSNANGQTAFRQLGDLATVPVDGTGNAINLNQTAAQAAASMNCTLTVPAQPAERAGPRHAVAARRRLLDGERRHRGRVRRGHDSRPERPAAGVQPAGHHGGNPAAVTPAAPTIARGSQVIIDVGFNGTNLVLQGRGAQQGRCVDALGQSVIGQVSACNAVNFYNLANFEIARGTLTVPPVGTSPPPDGQPCLTTRSFAVVDQDQSDNVITTYLINGNGQTAQNTAASAAGARRPPPPWSTAATTSCSPPSSTRRTGAPRSPRPTPPPPAVPPPRRRSTS